MHNVFRVLIIVVLCVGSVECGARAPKRPHGVPSAAIWSGGGDGGAWFDCNLEHAKQANLCAIYSDNDGSLMIRARYQLEGEHRGATADEFQQMWIDRIPSATVIHLANNKSLRAIEVLYV